MTSGATRLRWKGWSAPAAGTTDWLDLSHAVSSDVPRALVFPPPTVRRISSIPDDPINVTELQMVCHVGTHLDSPRHFIEAAPAIDEIPIERLHGYGVVWPVRASAAREIDAEQLRSAQPAVRPGEMVLLNTEWSRHAGTPVYDDHPWLSVDAASWLVEQQVGLLGLDLATPDLPVPRRAGIADFDWPVHRVLLSHGVLIVENLTGLRALAGHRVEVFIGAISIKHSDGAPARIFARPHRA
jgi:kynurenine formamidase